MLVFGASVWLVLSGFYFLFAGQVSLSEIAAGLPAAALATGFAVALRLSQDNPLRLKAPWFRIIGSPLLAIVPDAFRVGRLLFGVLWRRPSGPVGVVVRQPFRHGPDDDDEAAGRRALVTLATSVAPNGYVLRSFGEADTLILHRLVPAPSSRDSEWPLR
ncbi:MAG: hypothetical protein PHI71_08500 [Acidiphilium sp.]|jgi:hypothetical protein|nr:hypothetical protein [Acidiphilium sp.]